MNGFIDAAGGRLAGLDSTGDWSPVEVRGALRRLLHVTEHPPLGDRAEDAARVNARVNMRICSRPL
jgi:hypothetical protein